MATAFTKLYFAYGSNMRLHQMKNRCPRSLFAGMATLRGWKWLVNTRGVANIIQSQPDVVHGLAFLLTPEDEMKLDRFEGVPRFYQKRYVSVQLEGQSLNCLVYVDGTNTTPGEPREEYVERMNHAITDAEEKDVPTTFIQKYLRPFIPYRGKFRIEHVKYGSIAVVNDVQADAVVATGNIWNLNKINGYDDRYHITLASSQSSASAIEAGSLLVVRQASEGWIIRGVGKGYLIKKTNSGCAWKLENNGLGTQVKISSLPNGSHLEGGNGPEDLSQEDPQKVGDSKDLAEETFDAIGDEWRWKIIFLTEND